MSELAIAEQLRLHVKVYAEGGENSLHSHHFEDHAFFILAGEATFTGEDGSTTVVGPCDGMMIPRNAAYFFTSTGAENLVMLRIGAGDARATRDEGNTMSRASLDGQAIKNAGEPALSGEVFLGI